MMENNIKLMQDTCQDGENSMLSELRKLLPKNNKRHLKQAKF